MAKNQFLHILSRFYTLKMAQNKNGLPPIVYGSINLKKFSGVPNTSHTSLEVYKVASKIKGLTQFWAAGIPLSVRHKNKHPHPLIYLGGPEVGSKQNILIPM